MNYPLKISQYRNGALPKAEKILCRQPPLSDESRKDWFAPPRDHLDCYGCEEFLEIPQLLSRHHLDASDLLQLCETRILS
jgi:hypothetical protein